MPAANALLMGASDLGEAHFYSAFMTALHASNHALKAGSDTHRESRDGVAANDDCEKNAGTEVAWGQPQGRRRQEVIS